MHMNKKSKRCFVLNYFIFILVIIFVLYSIFTLYVSVTINCIIKRAFNDKDYDTHLNHIISENDYKTLNPRQSELEEGIKIDTDWSNTLPFVLPFFTDAYFKYSYIVTDKNTDEVVYGSLESHVTIKLDFTSFPVHISDIEQAP